MARSLSRSFAGGEITPEMFGRIDLASYQTGLAECTNFIVLPHGPVQNRPGFGFVREVKDSSKSTRLIPFSFSTTQTFVLEFGDQYIRFHTDGGTLESSPGVVYEVATPYLEADLFDLHYTQSADVLTVVHPNYAPRELRRLGALAWTLTTITFSPTLAAPGSVNATATGSGSDTHTYVVTALATDTLEESVASSSDSCTNDLTTPGNVNTIAWAAVSGTVRYNVYKQDNGLFGYIGQTSALSFVDDNVTPDVSETPPENATPFTGAGNYPRAVSYYEQRRIFAGTDNKPQNCWMTRTGTESNLSASIPTRDTDAISFRIAAREANTIRHIVPMSDLLLLTSAGEWRVYAPDGSALTPTALAVRPQTFVGANNVQPQVVNGSLLYPAAKGGRVREFVYSRDTTGSASYQNNDVSILAPHLFDYKTVVDTAFSRSPVPVLWAVSSGGDLLGLTYVPEQKVAGWHRHETDGVFESIAVVSEGDEDVLYTIIQRTIDGDEKRYVERLHTRQFDALEDAFFVDCGLTYEGSAATVISGLDHLEGETVAILGDGAVFPTAVVTGGAITLEQSVTKAHIGLPYTARIQTLPVAYEQIEAFGQGRPKNVNKVHMRVKDTSLPKAGPSTGALIEFKQRTNEPYGSPPALISSAEIEIVLEPEWNQEGGVYVQQDNPLPTTIVSMCLEAAVGG